MPNQVRSLSNLLLLAETQENIDQFLDRTIGLDTLENADASIAELCEDRPIGDLAEAIQLLIDIRTSLAIATQ